MCRHSSVIGHGVRCTILPLRRSFFCILIGVMPPLIMLPGGSAIFMIVPVVPIVPAISIEIGLEIALGGLQLVVLIL